MLYSLLKILLAGRGMVVRCAKYVIADGLLYVKSTCGEFSFTKLLMWVSIFHLPWLFHLQSGYSNRCLLVKPCADIVYPLVGLSWALRYGLGRCRPCLGFGIEVWPCAKIFTHKSYTHASLSLVNLSDLALGLVRSRQKCRMRFGRFNDLPCRSHWYLSVQSWNSLLQSSDHKGLDFNIARWLEILKSSSFSWVLRLISVKVLWVLARSVPNIPR